MANINNNESGLPFSGDNLISVSLLSGEALELEIYPYTVFKSQGMIKSLIITESIFSPIITGSIMLLDVGNFSDNYNMEGFENINIKFRIEIFKDGNPISILKDFKGTITQSSVVTDDAINSGKMNSRENYRIIKIDFINQDMFDNSVVEDTNYNNIPDNIYKLNDFVGWISDDGSRTQNTHTIVTEIFKTDL